MSPLSRCCGSSASRIDLDLAEEVRRFLGHVRAHLSDAAYRTHDEALLWVMRREVGPRFPKHELRRFAETSDPETAARELVACGFWIDHDGDGFEVLHHMEHQVEPEVIARRREMDAERQRKARLKKAGLADSDASQRDVQRDNVRDVQRDNTRDPGLGGPGLDGTSGLEGGAASLASLLPMLPGESDEQSKLRFDALEAGDHDDRGSDAVFLGGRSAAAG